MKNMGSESLGIRVIAVFSKQDGTVDVMLDCDLLGQVFVKVLKNEDGTYKADILDTGETNWGALGSFDGYVSVRARVIRSGLEAVKHCLVFKDEWVIIGQEDEFDMWALKRILPPEKITESLGYKIRFSLFAI